MLCIARDLNQGCSQVAKIPHIEKKLYSLNNHDYIKVVDLINITRIMQLAELSVWLCETTLTNQLRRARDSRISDAKIEVLTNIIQAVLRIEQLGGSYHAMKRLWKYLE